MAANVKIGDPQADEDLGGNSEENEGEYDETIGAITNSSEVNEESEKSHIEQDSKRFFKAGVGPDFESSFVSDHTPDNVSFAPPVASTPASGLQHDHVYPPSTGDSSDLSVNMSLLHMRPGAREAEAVNQDKSTSEFISNMSQPASLSTNVFSNSPSPAKKQRRRDSGLRHAVLRQNLMNAATPRKSPIKSVNPFQPSPSKKKWDGIVDLQHYTPTTSTEDSSIDFGFTPAEKLKFFSTPQYKLMRSTTEEAVAIRMAEVKARLPISDTSQSYQNTSTSTSEIMIPPTPLSAAKRKKQLRQSLLPRHSLGIKRLGLLRDDDDYADFDDDDTDFGDSPDISRKVLNQTQPPHDDSDSDSDFDFDGRDDSPAAQPQVYHSNSDTDSTASSDVRPPAAPAPFRGDEDDDFDDDDSLAAPPRGGREDFDTEYPNKLRPLDLGLTGDASDSTGPTETLFGLRPVGGQQRHLQQQRLEFERNLNKPLGGHVLPHLQPFDSPTPGAGISGGSGEKPPRKR